MNLRCAFGGLLALIASSLSASAADVIDITKAVRDAGKGTTELTAGGNYEGYSEQNAFGDGEEKADRVMLTNKYNVINWTIADDFERDRPVVVTKFLMKRTFPPDTASDYAVRRAPTDFLLQGSQDGSHWILLSRQVGLVWDKNEYVKTFEIDPVVYGDYRKYRLMTTKTNAESSDVVQCSFMYVNLFGTIGDYEPLSRTAKSVGYVVTDGLSSVLTDCKPTLDSKVEIDFAFGENVTTTQCIFASNYASGESFTNHFRLLTMNRKWVLFYGQERKESAVSVMPYGRYKVVVDGPVVTVNGVKVIEASEKLTDSADLQMAIFSSFSVPYYGLFERANHLWQNSKFYSLKVTDSSGKVTCDFEPVQTQAGTGAFRDKVSGRLFVSDQVERSLRMMKDFRLSDQEIDVTENVRTSGVAPTVTLVEGEDHDSYPVTNLFTRDETMTGRALFSDEVNVIQYDIPDTYHPGAPIVLSRFALVPCVGNTATLYDDSVQRAPNTFKLEGSTDGETWVELYAADGTGWGQGRFCKGGLLTVEGNTKGYRGVSIGIPEEKRGNYRHYRFSTFKTSYQYGYKMGLQELRLYGYVGGFEMAYEPVAYVRNASDTQKDDNTYFKTGVTPQACDLTIEMKGSFTRTNQTCCLFCSRDASSARTWTLFLINGALRLDCTASGTGAESAFRPEVNRDYTIKVEGNTLYVDGSPIYASGTTDFVPGSEIALLSSHRALADGSWDNQALFKLQSCKITDSCGSVIRDYIAVKRTDGKAGLFNRANDAPDMRFCASAGTDPIAGEPLDIDFWQRDRGVTLTTEPDAHGKLPEGSLAFALDGNQRLSAELYAAFDNVCRGADTNEWSEVVKLGDVKTGVNALEVTLPKTDYRRVKFFVCDAMECGVSQTRTYKTSAPGLMIIFR